MNADELADLLLDAIDNAKAIPAQTIYQGARQPLVEYRNELVNWKANTKQLIHGELGRDAARAFDEVGNPSVLGPTTDILDGVIAAYGTYLTELAAKVRQPKPAHTDDGPLPTPIPAFCSYSSMDDVHRARLKVALAVLEREGILKMWEFRSLEAGIEWDAEIRKHLHAAKLIILLVSPDFFASRYTVEEELTTALERHAAGTARVVPIIVRPCDWPHTDLRKLQALPQDGKPVIEWVSLDAAWQDVTNGIRRVIRSIRAVDAIAAADPPAALTKAQRAVMAVFADRGRRAGEGMPINVFVGDRAAMEAIDELANEGVLLRGRNNFVLLTERGYIIVKKIEST
ncbi:MAG: toll/interleukin-1 receptor domain-containing protein [Acidobacteriota bacterium]|nr:toll/interleukin-1 receptor domain-containing protein [Acidobacteriota bacterium]